jgi:hypothetical protein
MSRLATGLVEEMPANIGLVRCDGEHHQGRDATCRLLSPLNISA